MPDLDVSKAGGATGALSRATQLANQRAANARRIADMLRRRSQNRPTVPRGGRQLPSGGEGLANPALPPPPTISPSKVIKPNRGRDVLTGLGLDAQDVRDTAMGRVGFDVYPELQRGREPGTQGPIDATQKKGSPKLQPELGLGPAKAHAPGGRDPEEQVAGVYRDPYSGQVGNGPTVGVINPEQINPEDLARYQQLTPEQQREARKNRQQLRHKTGSTGRSIKDMLDLIKRDPLQDMSRLGFGQELADTFRQDSQNRLFTNQDLVENPFLTGLNELSVWSDYRIQVANWQDKKKKSGQTDGKEGGDNTIFDPGSFESVTGAGNLSPYLVARDENGLLYVTTADKWIQGKFADMRNDPAYAASMITAMAMTSAYGSDSTANGQRSRIVTDKDGNPVKAFVSSEDLSALKQLANQVSILQANGDEVSIDDSIAELTAMAADVTAEEQANGDFGGGGRGGGYGYGGGGYGGGGGGAGAVRYTDATQLTSLVSSIARQRMGRELTAAEAAAFVDYYHQQEAAQTAAYYAGQSNIQLDPEGQAVAWVNDHFGQESQQQQMGSLAAMFVQMMGSSQFLPGVEPA